MDAVNAVIIVSGIVGTLGAVMIGAWFTGRNERLLEHERQRREDRRARVETCVEFLTIFRQYRTYVMTHEVTVAVHPGEIPVTGAAFIKDAPDYTNAVQGIVGRLRLLEGGQGPADRRSSVGGAAGIPPLGAHPCQQSWGGHTREMMDAVRATEQDFIFTAHRELGLGTRSESAGGPS